MAARFQLRVMQQAGAPQNLMLEALSEIDARAQAERQGFTVLQIKPAISFIGNHSKSTFDLLLFCQEFRVLLEAGLSMVEVIDTLIQKEQNPSNRGRLQALLMRIQQGETLSQAMAAQPAIFPDLLVASIRATETTGNLPEALSRYCHYGEHIDLLKKRIVSATLYPALVVTFAMLVLTFLLLYVIPKFANIYETQVKTVSTSTQFILGLAKFSKAYGMFILLGLVALIVLTVWALNQPTIRSKLSAAMWKMPWLGDKIRLYHLLRFYRTFAMLLKSGVTVHAGLGMVTNMLGHSLTHHLADAKRMINEGKPFAEAFEAAQLSTPVAMRLFKVGEKTGTLENMMERAASFHEEQMVRWIDRFTKVFEPTLMAVIGLLIGGIVLLMYLPIFELASGID